MGNTMEKVSFALNISKDGDLLNIVDLRTDIGGRPRQMSVPFHPVRTSGVKAYFLCDRPSYLLGIGSEGDEHLSDQYQCSKELHKTVLAEGKGDIAKAVVSFYSKWDSERARNEKRFADSGCIGPVSCIFSIDGAPGFAHEDAEVLQLWERNCSESNESKVQKRCSVTNEMTTIAMMHDKIKGVYGAQPAGSVLVSFNSDAFESYGKKQSLNAPIGEETAFKYVAVLNWLLSDPRHHKLIGDDTYVFWANRKGIEEDIGRDLFCSITDVIDKERESVAESESRRISDIMSRIHSGLEINLSEEKLDEDVRFFILGLSPSNARISVRCWCVNDFGHLVRSYVKFFRDISVIGADNISTRRIINETVPKASEKERPSPRMQSELMDSILKGLPFPSDIFYSIINRIRADHLTNGVRVGALKGHLIRSDERYEGITMGLDDENGEPAYILGRLFATLEKAQKDSSKDRLETTIKDRYLSSAAATPATIFPVLLKLSRHHISKLEEGHKVFYEKLTSDLMSRIARFPVHQSLEEQGLFMIGYYHQEKNFYTKKGSADNV
ncbi:MAG: type I-C CRISPR-associated protein Cas8c/Csd1 [Methanomassiliicoccales archaeon]|nr:type I-C CRISPR-associated protein Cas8c/Csd1 [Methanomassiliicoccales archaeon]